MATIAELMVRLGLDSSKFQRGVGQAEKQTGGLRKSMGGVAKVAAGATAAVGAVGAGLFAMANSASKAGDEIFTSASKAGVAVESYQEMHYWANQNNVSAGSMDRAMGRLNQRIGRAADGNEKYSDALQRLGIDMDAVREGTLSTEDAMAQSIQALSQMETEQEKSAAASELFGTKLARDLMPALQDGSMSFEDAAERARELGIVMSEEQVEASQEFQQSWSDAKDTLGSITRDIGMSVMPIFQRFLDFFLEHMPKVRAIFSTVFGFIGNIIGEVAAFIGMILARIQSLWDEWGERLIGIAVDRFNMIKETIQNVLSTVWGIISSILETITGTFEGSTTDIWETVVSAFTQIQEVINNVLEFVMDFISGALEFIEEIWENNGEKIMETVSTVFNTVRDLVEMILTGVWGFIQEILTNIQEFWDEHGENIMKIVDFVFSAIQAIIQTVMPIIQHIIETVWGVIEGVFSSVLDIILGIVGTFISLFTGDWEGLGDSLERIWDGLWGAIVSILEGVWNLISPVLSGLWDNISEWFVGLKDDAMEWGKNMIQGFIDGIRNMFGNIRDAASDAVSAAADFIKFWSPARKGEGRFIVDWGENMIDGFLDGVRGSISDVQNVMSQVIPDMTPQIQQSQPAPKQQPQPNHTSADNSEIIALLKQIAENSGGDIYLGREKVGEVMDEEQAKRTGLYGRKVAF